MTTPIPRARPLAMDAFVPLTAPLPDDEARLVDELRSGRPRAAEKLAEATYGRLYAACHRMTGSAEEARDLVQETYRKAWRALSEFRGDARFSTWLFRIAWTTHVNALRRPRLVVPLEDEQAVETQAHPEPSPEATAAAGERASRLRRAVADLPEDLRYPVVAHYWAELPVREIADSEGITPVAVRKRLARAFRLLAAALEEKTR
jgi:RNA polymerase sigma-70 factor (ECF subfamily)